MPHLSTTKDEFTYTFCKVVVSFSTYKITHTAITCCLVHLLIVVYSIHCIICQCAKNRYIPNNLISIIPIHLLFLVHLPHNIATHHITINSNLLILVVLLYFTHLNNQYHLKYYLNGGSHTPYYIAIILTVHHQPDPPLRRRKLTITSPNTFNATTPSILLCIKVRAHLSIVGTPSIAIGCGLWLM